MGEFNLFLLLFLLYYAVLEFYELHSKPGVCNLCEVILFILDLLLNHLKM